MKQTYIALLRGVNVGGNNKIDMKQLKAAFNETGFDDVRTYINSGNVIFLSELDESTAQVACESVIREWFGLNIAVAILTADELREAFAHAPDWWGSDINAKHNAIFVIQAAWASSSQRERPAPPATAEAVCTEVGEIKPEYEKCDYYGKLIFWSAPMETFSMTRWSSVSKRTTYQKITIRNANTAFKLAELVKG
jgi:uncharacterized protein (DUF1697 family)